MIPMDELRDFPERNAAPSPESPEATE